MGMDTDRMTVYEKGGEVEMIQIDMEMPAKCSECRMQTDYDYCSAMPKNFCGNTEDNGKPEWCPLKEAPVNGGWVSVKERLPVDEFECLVVNKSGSYWIGWFKADEQKWVIDGTICADGFITSWLPLP